MRDYDAEVSRIQRFPAVVDRTKAKLVALASEARRYNDRTLLTCLDAANRAWDQAIEEAQNAAHVRGGSIGFGDGRR
jgi:hypothetical protein